ncbi:hypothetical protein GIB67_034325 [Kingdonia uniflora]|uniref:Uncharacterized protein n=1 Tax=Kingdonia uniflora TaxID=39325 RepID=A0A7J7NS60_9MAGN|nr:hypothetical protein GIB67_034325 [Kingdonia uniflora]
MQISNIVYKRFKVRVSYYTAWNTRNMVMEKIAGSYDKGYALCPKLCVEIQKSNPGSIATCSREDGNLKFADMYISFKAALDGFTKGCRPILGLDRSFLKGKYGGQCLSIILLDANNGLFLIAVLIYRKNLDKLGVAKYDAKTWLEREPYESWYRSYFDTSTKCEHMTNNFSESFNNWIVKIRDKPLNKMVVRLNLMQMTLMYERKLKAREWDQNGLVPRAVKKIELLKTCSRHYRLEGFEKDQWLVLNFSKKFRFCIYVES